MTLHTLVPFTPTDLTRCYTMQVQLEASAKDLALLYRLQGPIPLLFLPEMQEEPCFQDELWTTTCFECFIKSPKESSYEEWNFSPSRCWAHYIFRDYRQKEGSGKSPATQLDIRTTCGPSTLELDVRIPLAPATSDLAIGLSCVLEAQDGNKTYWALNHPCPKPDFHDPRSFAIQLRT